MFLCVSAYSAPLAEVDAVSAAHRRFLVTLEARDLVVLAGRQEPPAGGVVVLRGDSLEQVQRLLQDDPYVQRGVATYTVTEFTSQRGAATG